MPLFLFSVLFGLSMDYQVFLLSRIKERYDATGSTTDAVTHGVASTARLITGAALIIVAVFSGFALGDLVMFQQMGFGVAVALLIDATIIRSVLLPAAMRLLDGWNWYLPHWLEWLPQDRGRGASRGACTTAKPGKLSGHAEGLGTVRRVGQALGARSCSSWRSSIRRILPVSVFGRSLTNSIARG